MAQSASIMAAHLPQSTSQIDRVRLQLTLFYMAKVKNNHKTFSMIVSALRRGR